MIRRHDMLIYDERKRFPSAFYALAILLAGPFVYLALTKVALAYLTVRGGCTFVNLASQCTNLPNMTVVFNTLSLLHVVYARLAMIRPELKYLQMLMYMAGVIVAFLPFALRNYRAGLREYFLLAFLASGAISTLFLK